MSAVEQLRIEPHRDRKGLLAGAMATGLVAVYAVEWLVATLSSVDAASPVIAWAVAVDLVVVLPLAYYFVAVRRLGWPWLSTVPVALVGLFTARVLVPDAQGLLTQLEWLLVPAELAILVVIAVRARAGLRRFASELGSEADGEADSVDSASAMRKAAAEVVGEGRAAEVLATEMSIFHHAFGYWRRPLPEGGETHFFARERSGYGLLVGGVAIATAVEIFPVHLFLSHFWSPIAAWIATGLAVYGVIWLVGDWQAARRMPTELGPDALKVRVGLRWRVDLPLESIESMRRVASSEVRVAEALQAFPAGRPTHCLELRAPIVAVGPYGLRKAVQRIALLVDEPARFEAALQAVLKPALEGEPARQR